MLDLETASPAASFARRILAAGAVVALITALAVAAIAKIQGDKYCKLLCVQDPAANAPADKVDPGGAQTILLVGNDQRKKVDAPGSSRADTMLLVRLDPNANTTKVLSLPRDLKVQIPGRPSLGKLGEAYATGNPKTAAPNLQRTIKLLLSQSGEKFRIQKFISIRFVAFSQAVNTLNCIYSEVDRRYFNDNKPPNGGGDPYSEIDLKAGYQRLCGEDALSFVRFRHSDDDTVRAARQAEFLSEARGQVAASKLVSKTDDLLKAMEEYLNTNIGGSTQLLGLVKLALGVSDKPTQKITLKTELDAKGEYLLTDQASITRAVRQFLGKGTPPGGKKTSDSSRTKSANGEKKKKKSNSSSTAIPPGLVEANAAAKQAIAQTIAGKTDSLPIYYPKLASTVGSYDVESSRAYDIASAGGRTWPWVAYKLVFRMNKALGQYYGVQGTAWKSPPAYSDATDSEKIGGLKFKIQWEARAIRRMFWKNKYGTFWISNTLKNDLSNRQMRAIARSITRYGS